MPSKPRPTAKPTPKSIAQAATKRPTAVVTPPVGRPVWSSQLTFFLATVGSAIGLGNVWRFSWLVGEHGGGAFILVYLGAVALLGLPLMLAEFAIGKSGGADPVKAYQAAKPNSLWWVLGALGVLSCAIILAYYAVIAGWVARYAWLALSGQLFPMPSGGFAAGFTAFKASPEPVFWQALIMLVTGSVVALGVTKGIEKLCLYLMPTLAVLLIALAVYANTLPGSSLGLGFLLVPDWSKLYHPDIYLVALGHAFFSLSVGYGIMLTYGAYAGPKQSLGKTAVLTSIGDTTFALVAALMIFPAVFAFGLNPGSGPALAFITMPQVFANLPASGLLAGAFFLLLLGAALTSTVSMLEVAIAALLNRTRFSRTTLAWGLTGGLFLLGLPTALGYGLLSHIQPFQLSLLDAYDTLTNNFLLPLTALGTAIFVGWVWSPAKALTAAGLMGTTWASVWQITLRYVTPLAILAIFARSMGLL